jgi:hypothetical protein
VLGDTIVDAYVPLQSGKEMWDALEQRYGVSDAGSELYIMEQFHDYRMVPALLPFCTASSGTTTPTSAMSTSTGMNATGYNLPLIVSHIIYIF